MKKFESHLTNGVSSLSEIQNRFSSVRSESIKPTNDFSITLEYDQLSEESKKLLVSYNETFRRLFKNTMMFGSLHIESSELDYSLLISPLAKVLETELNLSLMRWFKQNIKDDRVDLCDEKGDAKSSFSLGEICFIATRQFNNGCVPQGVTDAKEFLSILKNVRDLRNSAAHTGCTNRGDFERFYGSFSSFVELGYMKVLMSIKEEQ